MLFLVDRNNLGKQAYTEFDNFVTPDDGRKFTELYNVERLGAAAMKDSTKVVISTVQRLYARLRGEPVIPTSRMRHTTPTTLVAWSRSTTAPTCRRRRST